MNISEEKPETEVDGDNKGEHKHQLHLYKYPKIVIYPKLWVLAFSNFNASKILIRNFSYQEASYPKRNSFQDLYSDASDLNEPSEEGPADKVENILQNDDEEAFKAQ